MTSYANEPPSYSAVQQQPTRYPNQPLQAGAQPYYGAASAPPEPAPIPPVPGYGAVDPEAAWHKPALAFDDRSVRRGFLRKVFSLLTIMLLMVAGMVALFTFQSDCRLFVQQNSWLYWISFFVFFGVLISLTCCSSVRRQFPLNIILLALLTLAIGYMTAMISAFYETEIVFLTMGICALVCFCIILFSMQTKWDFTGCIGIMACVSMVLVMFGLFVIIGGLFFDATILNLVYAGLAALVFMVYLAIDVQLIMGNKKVTLSPEEYIFATMQLFLDIIMIFWMLLELIGFASR